MALGEIRYALQTNRSALLSVQSRGIGHGNPGLVARLGQGDDVDHAECVFRAPTRVETAAPYLGWLSKGVFRAAADPCLRSGNRRASYFCGGAAYARHRTGTAGSERRVACA